MYRAHAAASRAAGHEFSARNDEALAYTHYALAMAEKARWLIGPSRALVEQTAAQMEESALAAEESRRRIAGTGVADGSALDWLLRHRLLPENVK